MENERQNRRGISGGFFSSLLDEVGMADKPNEVKIQTNSSKKMTFMLRCHCPISLKVKPYNLDDQVYVVKETKRKEALEEVKG